MADHFRVCPPRKPLLARGANSSGTLAFHEDTDFVSLDDLTQSDRRSGGATKDKSSDPQYIKVGTFDKDYGLPPNERSGWLARKIRDWWIGEILSLLCSLASLTAIVVVLAKHDQKPSKNLAAGVSLNTYLAVFATIAKAGFLYPVMNCIGQLKWIWFARRGAPLIDFSTFDGASRGPWDSFLLLKRLKPWHTVSIGALISISAIGISPITQQAIAYPNKLVPSVSDSPAQVPTSNWWGGSGVNTFHPDVYSAPLSLPIKQAINNALFTLSTEFIAPATPTCPTGNCTWVDYDSLAVCSKVTNVTNMLNVTLDVRGPDTGSSQAANATLPNGAYLTLDLYTTNITSGSYGSDLTLLTDDTSMGLMILNAYIIYERDGRNIVTVSNNTVPIFNAVEIVFYWCVNTYRTSVVNGTASTEILESSSSNVTTEDTNTYRNVSIVPPKGNAIYNVTFSSNLVLGAYFNEIWNGDYFGGAPGNIESSSNDLVSILQPIITANNSALVNEGLGNYTGNMATSMSNTVTEKLTFSCVRTYIGDASTPQTIYVNGTSYVVVTFVQIRWPWLSLLIGLLAASILFLLGTIIQTTRSGVDAMKSDALAAATCLSPEARGYIGPTALQNGTIEKAEGLKLRLNKTENGWSLHPVD